MLHNLSGDVKDCLERAARARTLANKTSDPKMKAFYQQRETGWLYLAESYQVSERLKRYLLARSKSSSEWYPIASVPCDRDLELAVIEQAVPPVALLFPCRRVDHGWIDADTEVRIDVEPTHWREWLDPHRD